MLTGVATMAVSGWILWSRGGSGVVREQAPTPEVRSEDATASRSDGSRIVAPGRVEPRSEALEVSAEVSGRITSLHVEEGDHVAAGTVVVELERAEYEARVATARAALAGAEAEEARLINGARVEERREARLGQSLRQRASRDELGHLEVLRGREGSALLGHHAARERIDDGSRWHEFQPLHVRRLGHAAFVALRAMRGVERGAWQLGSVGDQPVGGREFVGGAQRLGGLREGYRASPGKRHEQCEGQQESVMHEGYPGRMLGCAES